jgi:hypothetical protein
MDSPTTDLWGGAQYWGMYAGAESSRPEMLTRLFLSIFDFVKTRCDSEAAPISKPSLTCHMFGTLLDKLEVEKLLPHNPEEIAGWGLEGVDRVFKAYFDAFDLSYHQVQRHQPNQKSCILLFRGSFVAHLDTLVCAYPDHMNKVLNDFLADDLLVDPLTDLPFAFKTIPIGCFPSQNDSSVQLYNQRREAFKTVRSNLVQEVNDSRQRAQTAARMAQSNAYPVQSFQGGPSLAEAQAMAYLAKSRQNAQLMIYASQKQGQEAIASAIW